MTFPARPFSPEEQPHAIRQRISDWSSSKGISIGAACPRQADEEEVNDMGCRWDRSLYSWSSLKRTKPRELVLLEEKKDEKAGYGKSKAEREQGSLVT